jgi:hypothetical protein
MKIKQKVFLFLILLSIISCQRFPKKASELAPEDLLGMKKTTILEGKAAIEDVKKKHIGKVENMQDTAIVNYGPPRHPVILWITLYKDKKTAQEENEKMAKAIVKYGDNWGKNLTQFTVKKRRVYRTSPDGYEEHYFWVEKNWLFYVKMPQIFQSKLNEIIQKLEK